MKKSEPKLILNLSIDDEELEKRLKLLWTNMWTKSYVKT